MPLCASIGMTEGEKEKFMGDEDVCIAVDKRLYTYARFMCNQNGPKWQPLPVFICSRISH